MEDRPDALVVHQWAAGLSGWASLLSGVGSVVSDAVPRTIPPRLSVFQWRSLYLEPRRARLRHLRDSVIQNRESVPRDESPRRNRPSFRKKAIAAERGENAVPVVAPGLETLEQRLERHAVRNLAKVDRRFPEIDGDGVTVPVRAACIRVLPWVHLDAALRVDEQRAVSAQILDDDVLIVVHSIPSYVARLFPKRSRPFGDRPRPGASARARRPLDSRLSIANIS